MKPYNCNDNDTYVDLYYNNIIKDTEVHMFKDKKNESSLQAVHTKLGTVRGNFSVESYKKAANNVLHFPNSRKMNLKLIKSKDMINILPQSLRMRYQYSFDNTLYKQKTPIYFNSNTEKFIRALDYRVLRDMKDYPEFKEEIQKLCNNGCAEIVNIENNEVILLKYDTLNGVLYDEGNIHKNIANFYDTIFANEAYRNGKDVIIFSYNIKKNWESEIITINPKDISSLLYYNSHIEFDFIKAKKITNIYFLLYDKDEKLSKKTFYYNKDEVQQNQTTQNRIDIINIVEQKNILITPYSDQDWSLLISLKMKLDNIFNDLNTLLLAQKTSVSLDKPISEINPIKLNFLLEDKVKKLSIKQ